MRERCPVENNPLANSWWEIIGEQWIWFWPIFRQLDRQFQEQLKMKLTRNFLDHPGQWLVPPLLSSNMLSNDQVRVFMTVVFKHVNIWPEYPPLSSAYAFYLCLFFSFFRFFPFSLESWFRRIRVLFALNLATQGIAMSTDGINKHEK